MEPLVEEAAKKAAVAWLAVPGAGPAYLVWCAWIDGSLLVVTGPGEQSAPGLAEAATVQGATVEVSLRGDHGGRIVTWPATVERLEPEGETWQQLVPQLAAKRLNGDAGDWAQRCVVVRLTPGGELLALPSDAQAAPPKPSPATRLPRRPFKLHKVKKRP